MDVYGCRLDVLISLLDVLTAAKTDVYHGRLLAVDFPNGIALLQEGRRDLYAYNLPHITASSSDPSLQCFVPSHTEKYDMQRPPPQL